MPALSLSVRRIVVTGILLILAAGYFSAGLLGVEAHRDAGEMDTTGYLAAAFDVHRTGGILRHIPNCFTGAYTEATQHPLYLLALSPFAERDILFFVNAKLVSLTIGFLFLGIFFAAGRAFFGGATALVAVCLVLSGATFLHMTTMVACEGLLSLFLVLFWWFAAKGFEDRRWWPAAGAAAGLAFLSKSIGIFALPVFAATVLWFHRREMAGVLKDRRFWAFFGVFVLVSLPLFARNIRVFGNPLYSDSSAVLWIDQWRDYDRTDKDSKPPTLGSYLKSHPPAAIADTLSKGLFVRNPLMVSDGLKPFAFWKKPIDLTRLRGFHERTVPWQDAWALGLLALAAAGLWIERRKPLAVICGVNFILFFVFIAWYSKVFPGSPPTRLLFPALFIVPLFAARALAAVAEKIGAKRNISAVLPLLALAAVFSTAYLYGTRAHYDWKTVDVRKSYAFEPLFVTQLAWVSQNATQEGTVLVGATFMNYLFYFRDRLKGEFILWPQIDRLEDVQILIRERSIDAGILDLATVAYAAKAYRPYYDVGPRIGLRAKAEMPPPFRKIMSFPPNRTLYDIYAFDRQA